MELKKKRDCGKSGTPPGGLYANASRTGEFDYLGDLFRVLRALFDNLDLLVGVGRVDPAGLVQRPAAIHQLPERAARARFEKLHE